MVFDARGQVAMLSQQVCADAGLVVLVVVVMMTTIIANFIMIAMRMTVMMMTMLHCGRLCCLQKEFSRWTLRGRAGVLQLNRKTQPQTVDM